jgi:hypothetical protein
MPKSYFCNKITDGIQCKDINPENFEKGRYSICKKCRIKNVMENKSYRNNMELYDKVKKIDPKEELQLVVEYSLKNKNFTGELSIFDNIEILNKNNKELIEKIDLESNDKQKIIQNFDKLEKNHEAMRLAFNSMRDTVVYLDSELTLLKRNIDIDTLFKRIKDLENFKRDLLDEKFMKENTPQ